MKLALICILSSMFVGFNSETELVDVWGMLNAGTKEIINFQNNQPTEDSFIIKLKLSNSAILLLCKKQYGPQEGNQSSPKMLSSENSQKIRNFLNDKNLTDHIIKILRENYELTFLLRPNLEVNYAADRSASSLSPSTSESIAGMVDQDIQPSSRPGSISQAITPNPAESGKRKSTTPQSVDDQRSDSSQGQSPTPAEAGQAPNSMRMIDLSRLASKLEQLETESVKSTMNTRYIKVKDIEKYFEPIKLSSYLGTNNDNDINLYMFLVDKELQNQDKKINTQETYKVPLETEIKAETKGRPYCYEGIVLEVFHDIATKLDAINTKATELYEISNYFEEMTTKRKYRLRILPIVDFSNLQNTKNALNKLNFQILAQKEKTPLSDQLYRYIDRQFFQTLTETYLWMLIESGEIDNTRKQEIVNLSKQITQDETPLDNSKRLLNQITNQGQIKPMELYQEYLKKQAQTEFDKAKIELNEALEELQKINPPNQAIETMKQYYNADFQITEGSNPFEKIMNAQKALEKAMQLKVFKRDQLEDQKNVKKELNKRTRILSEYKELNSTYNFDSDLRLFINEVFFSGSTKFEPSTTNSSLKDILQKTTKFREDITKCEKIQKIIELKNRFKQIKADIDNTNNGPQKEWETLKKKDDLMNVFREELNMFATYYGNTQRTLLEPLEKAITAQMVFDLEAEFNRAKQMAEQFELYKTNKLNQLQTLISNEQADPKTKRLLPMSRDLTSILQAIRDIFQRREAIDDGQLLALVNSSAAAQQTGGSSD